MNLPLLLLSTACELPPHDEWLLAPEQAALRRLRVPKRRGDFRLGRFGAKRALALLEGGTGSLGELRRFEVRPAPGGAPQAFRDGAPQDVSLSISHSEGWAAAAVRRGGEALGCDIEQVAARSRAFLEDYLSPDEQSYVAAAPECERARRATLVWSAKEAVMKALAEGLRLPPLAVRVAPGEPLSGAGWSGFAILGPRSALCLHGFWRSLGGFVLTVAGGREAPTVLGPIAARAPRAETTSARLGSEGC